MIHHAAGLKRFRMWLLVLSLPGLTACTVAPTPYQPLADASRGGYEETRLQKDVYRVTFRVNQDTPEATLMDYLFLRSAELTEAAGYTHFIVSDKTLSAPESTEGQVRFGFGLGFGSGGGGSYTGMGLGISTPAGGGPYRLGVFQIRMLTTAEAKQHEQAYDAAALIRRLSPQEKAPGKPGSKDVR